MKNINIDALYKLIDISLPKISIKDVDIDKLLDDRDLPEFEDDWLKSFENLSNLTLTEDQKTVVNMLRERSFKKIFSLTENPDLASYVSDDFEIMAKYLFSDKEDEWVLKCLITNYANGKFSH